jgi:hypothetical protein
MKYIATRDTTVFDLYVSFSSGAKTQLKLKKGEVLPYGCLNTKDIDKSLKFGGLGRLLNTGWIVAVDEADIDKKVKEINSVQPLPSEIVSRSDSPKKEQTKPYSNIEVADQNKIETKREEGMTEIIKIKKTEESLPVEMIQFDQAVGTDKSGGIVPVGVELQPTDPRNPNGEKVMDFSEIHTFTAFEELNHPDQLSFIKQSSNKTLLTELMTKSPKKQIQNNSRRRLEEIK